MENLYIRPFEATDMDAVVALWDVCALVPSHQSAEDLIARKVAFQPELFWVAMLDGELVGTLMTGYEGRRGWLNGLGVLPEFRKRGIARALVRAAEARLVAMGCAKVNLQVRGHNTGVVDFYKNLGYDIDDTVSMGKRL
jgi:ribosomal protein S18 acetylase RimI-like enzyme